MLNLGPLGVTAPLVLWGLAALPLLWWLVRRLPPPPRRQTLPTIALLPALDDAPPPRRQPPPWLLLLRLLLLACLILALAAPVWNPARPRAGQGPLLIVLDNGWTAAPVFGALRQAALVAVEAAGQAQRPVQLVLTAPPPGGWPGGGAIAGKPQPAAAVRGLIEAAQPQPWASDRAGLAGRLPAIRTETLWLTDGIGDGGEGVLASALLRRGPVRAASVDWAGPMAFRKVEATNGGWIVEIIAPPAGMARQVLVSARDGAGRELGAVPVVLDAGAQAASARLEFAPQQRMQATALQIGDGGSAGAVYLLDATQRRPLIGLVGGDEEAREILRAPDYFVRRALEPYAALREDDPRALIEAQAGLMFLMDVVPDRATGRAILDWVGRGGVAVSFAGPRIARSGTPLEAAPLASGARSMGGALTWDAPQRLRPFPEGSPFHGLTVPDEVRVLRQVLPDPAARPRGGAPVQVWSRLADGTPLITARQQGAGLVVLVHTSPEAQWSTLPYSGLFVDLLRRLVPLASAPALQRSARTDALWRADDVLDGFGELHPVSGPVAPLRIGQARVGPRSPPGLYRAADETRALNLANVRGPIGLTSRLSPMERLPHQVMAASPQDKAGRPLATWLWGAALLLLALDSALLAWRLVPGRWRLPAIRKPAATAMLVLLALTVIVPMRARAQSVAADDVQLGYVAAQGPRDRLARDGLRALSSVLDMRTAVRPGAPVAVEPGRGGLGRLSLLYWRVGADTRVPGDAAVASLRDFLARGGLLVIDTGTPGEVDSSALRTLLAPLDLPPLVPLKPGHVLTRSFYLVEPAAGVDLWVEKGTEGDSGRVSGVVIGPGDWAAAWAGEGSFGLVRERALRFGINLVMYALTGTYKADQVHDAALLRRERGEAP